MIIIRLQLGITILKSPENQLFTRHRLEKPSRGKSSLAHKSQYLYICTSLEGDAGILLQPSAGEFETL